VQPCPGASIANSHGDGKQQETQECSRRVNRTIEQGRVPSGDEELMELISKRVTSRRQQRPEGSVPRPGTIVRRFDRVVDAYGQQRILREMGRLA
jgi:hypothetical protein